MRLRRLKVLNLKDKAENPKNRSFDKRSCTNKCLHRVT